MVVATMASDCRLVGWCDDVMGLVAVESSVCEGPEARLIVTAVDDADVTGVVTKDVVVVDAVTRAMVGGMGSLLCDAMFEVIEVARECTAFGSGESTCVLLVVTILYVRALCVMVGMSGCMSAANALGSFKGVMENSEVASGFACYGSKTSCVDVL